MRGVWILVALIVFALAQYGAPGNVFNRGEVVLRAEEYEELKAEMVDLKARNALLVDLIDRMENDQLPCPPWKKVQKRGK